MATQPIPEGYNTVSPYLAVDDAEKAIEYYKKAFGAEETVRMDAPDGRIGHAELKIGDSHVMLSDPFPQAIARRRRRSSAARARASSCTSRTSTRSCRRRSTPARR